MILRVHLVLASKESSINLSQKYFCHGVALRKYVISTHLKHHSHDKLPLGVDFLAKAGYHLNISRYQTEDRNKANILAKSLVCIQVTWMLVQRIVRKSAGYPLTLLEIHTTVHVVCALFIYAIWWKVSS